ncbi:hypothetical protein COHA_002949 [Chlorella ohadii]|uniref:Uncharacterized protein n=1 Tax=Chlorella ohadii TaxID=2649997 RepID=A0AAD5DVV0_9CHLO|nr:hypothetical protein COHA_002949 [Chlorella ohadii]
MWELVATAVAGLNAGAGLQAALAGAPSGASDSLAFTKFASRSRMLGLFLSTVSTSACVMAYTGESRGALWLAAAAGVGIGIPFNLLLMAPPTAVVGGGSMRLEPYGPPSPRVRFAGDEPSSAAASDAALADQAATAAAAGRDGGSAFEAAAAVPPAPERGILSSASADVQRRRRLMYSKSGVLVSPTDFAASWSKK